MTDRVQYQKPELLPKPGPRYVRPIGPAPKQPKCGGCAYNRPLGMTGARVCVVDACKAESMAELTCAHVYAVCDEDEPCEDYREA